MSAPAEMTAPPALSPSAPPPPRFGKIEDEPIEVYHGGNAVSKTRIDIFRHSPRLYWKRFVAKLVPKDPPGEALIIGSAVDALALEGPHEFARRFVVAPSGAPRRPSSRQINAKKPSDETIVAIDFWRAFDAQNVGKMPLDGDQLALVNRMADALHSNAEFAALRAVAQSQVTFRLKGKRFAVQCRPDLWCEDGTELTDGMPAIVDLKTIQELPEDDPDHLPRHIAKFGYHRGAHLYREITSNVMRYRDEYRPPFVLCFVEKQEPHAVICRVVDEVALGIGERECQEALERMNGCYERDVWPESWGAPLAPVSLPQYYIRRSLENAETNLWG